MRRCSHAVVSRTVAATTTTTQTTALVPLPATCTSVRHFVCLFDVVCSLLCCAGCMASFACLANNYRNVRKYGFFRFSNVHDFNIMAEDFAKARCWGAAFGLLFYWFVVGPDKYRTSDQALFPGNVRFGPF